MTRRYVRSSVASWLKPTDATGPVFGLSEVFPYPPRVTVGDVFDFSAWGGVGGCIYLYIPRQYEQRIAVGGPHNGRKKRIYNLDLLCVFRSPKQEAEQVSALNDDFLDGIVARIQADRNLGTAPGQPGAEVGPGTIFMAGEGETFGAPDLEVTSHIPRQIRGELVQIISTVKFAVEQILDT